MKELIKIYLNPKENLTYVKNNPKPYGKLFFFYVLPFSLFPILGYLIGFTVLKDSYISSLSKFIEMLKADPKASVSTIQYATKVLTMIQNNDTVKMFSFLFIAWIFQIFKPIFLTGLVYFFGKAFGGEDNPLKVFNLVVLAVIPVWIAGISYMVNSPVNAFLIFLSSFYMFYLIFVGAEKVLGIPSENSKNFQFIVVIVIFYVILSGIIGLLKTNLMEKIL
ncbi:YIP1 family protein [Sulfurihydrogenibium sp.]|jgi:hypothetical protein|uniref:YIP1 family protein n=1 Tax=Sulfurihydrogenibium sp. TaxID=2053621 RepID=UPI000CA86822|nr:MAG: hypothetical protein C0198_03540 [Sulfurihydrogenibium sp.]